MEPLGQQPEIAIGTYLAITDVKANYFDAVDSKNWARLRKVFTDSARFEGFPFPAGDPDQFVESIAAAFVDVRSTHRASMPRVRVVGEGRIRVRWLMQDYVTWPIDSRPYRGVEIPGLYGFRGYGAYEDEYRLTEAGWRIDFTRLTRTRIDPLVDTEPLDPNLEGVLVSDPEWLV